MISAEGHALIEADACGTSAGKESNAFSGVRKLQNFPGPGVLH